ncbi:hypothetical protein A2U01_0069265, partial [Trifolium medium]|nr:hypothetical protein [Trifolium medium]
MAEDQKSVIAAYGNVMTSTPSQIGYGICHKIRNAIPFNSNNVSKYA